MIEYAPLEGRSHWAGCDETAYEIDPDGQAYCSLCGIRLYPLDDVESGVA